jgi:hypothetical protein
MALSNYGADHTADSGGSFNIRIPKSVIYIVIAILALAMAIAIGLTVKERITDPAINKAGETVDNVAEDLAELPEKKIEAEAGRLLLNEGLSHYILPGYMDEDLNPEIVGTRTRAEGVAYLLEMYPGESDRIQVLNDVTLLPRLYFFEVETYSPDYGRDIVSVMWIWQDANGEWGYELPE